MESGDSRLRRRGGARVQGENLVIDSTEKNNLKSVLFQAEKDLRGISTPTVMKAAGWKVEYLGDRTGFIIYGYAPARPTRPLRFAEVKEVGIQYSGAAQPIQPGTQGGVQLLTLEKGKWKPMPKPK